MKCFSYVVYLCLLTSVQLLHGPAKDQQHRYRYTKEKEEDIWNTFCEQYVDYYESDGTVTQYQYSKSNCIDRNLHWPGYTTNRGNEYFDHCCYMRYQDQGNLVDGCVGLKELEYLDIKETINKFEQEEDLKIFEINCSSSFTYLSVAVIISLLGLLL